MVPSRGALHNGLQSFMVIMNILRPGKEGATEVLPLRPTGGAFCPEAGGSQTIIRATGPEMQH